jgi:CHAT domain-containing protein/tetratricopeptide (TPR) repeat protein
MSSEFTGNIQAATPQENLARLALLRSEGKIDEALEGYLALAKVADGRIAAYAHFFAGQILLEKDQTGTALTHLREALRMAQEQANAELALYSRFQLGIAAGMEERLIEAQIEFDRCLQEAEQAKNILMTERAHFELLRLVLRSPAHTEVNIDKGIMPHIQPLLRSPAADRADEIALRSTLRLDAADALLNSDRKKQLAPLALRLANAHLEQNPEKWLLARARAEAALARYTEALASLKKLPEDNADAVILEADIYFELGQEEKGFALLQKASVEFQGHLTDRLAITSHLAHLLLQARHYAEAAPLLEALSAQTQDRFIRSQALLDLASLALASDDASLAEQRIRASGVTNTASMRLLAAALIAQDKTDEAAQAIGQAAQSARAGKDTAELTLLEAWLAHKSGDEEQAASAAEKAEQIARAAAIPRIEAEALILQALMADANTAAVLLTRAESIAISHGWTQMEANIRHNLGVLALMANKNDEAIRGFRRALELFDETRAGFALRSEERLHSTASWSVTQRFLALAYLAQGKLEAAWEAYEYSLARDAREALAESLLRYSADFAESVRAQEKALAALQKARETGASRDEIEKRARALAECTKRVEQDLRAGERGKNPDSVKLAAFSQALRKSGTLALQYLVWPDQKPGVVFIIDGYGISAAELPPSDRLLRRASDFKELAARPLVTRTWDAATLGTKAIDNRMSFVTNGLALSDLLLAPMEKQWYASQASNLLIIADGELAGFPFAALPLAESEWRGKIQWPVCIGDAIPIATAVSASAWIESELLARSSGKVILAGDVGERRIRDGRIFSALPGSGRELDILAKLFGQRALHGNDANPERLTSLLRESPAILHLATHGFFLTNAATGKRIGSLLLADGSADPPAGATPVGSIFDESMIAALPLAGSLITLSACESARGRLVPGEGMISLMRAFIIAGAKNASASLWLVGDDSTVEYMNRYYKHIAAGVRPSIAHRNTRRELLALGFWPSQRSGFITSN